MLIIIAIFAIGTNMLCTYFYRKGSFSDQTFIWILSLVNGANVYFAIRSLGGTNDQIGMILFSIIGGILLGFQGARVIVKYRHIERAKHEDS